MNDSTEHDVCEWLRAVHARVPHLVAVQLGLKAKRKFRHMFAAPSALQALMKYLLQSPWEDGDKDMAVHVVERLESVPYTHHALMSATRNVPNEAKAMKIVCGRLTPNMAASARKVAMGCGSVWDVFAHVTDRVERDEEYWPTFDRHIPGCAMYRERLLGEWRALVDDLTVKLRREPCAGRETECAVANKGDSTAPAG